MRHKRNIFMDLDGTLVDTRTGIFKCLRQVMSALDLPQRSDSDLSLFIGAPIVEGLSLALGSDDPVILKKALGMYNEIRSSCIIESVVYPGIESVLESLHMEGKRIFCVSTKPIAYAEKVVCYFPFGRFLDRVYGYDVEAVIDIHSEKGAIVHSVLETEKIKAKDSIMFGDRMYDIAAAKKNNICSVGVLWGYGTRDELERAGADYIIKSPCELMESTFR